jgi:hypothetical protein
VRVESLVDLRRFALQSGPHKRPVDLPASEVLGRDLTRLRIGNTIPNGGIDLLLGYSFRCVDLPIDRTVQRLLPAIGKFDAPAGTEPV